MQEEVEIPLEVMDSYAKLVKTLTEWGKHYANSKPIVSDFVYDEEYKKLKAIELQSTLLTRIPLPRRLLLIPVVDLRR